MNKPSVPVGLRAAICAGAILVLSVSPGLAVSPSDAERAAEEVAARDLAAALGAASPKDLPFSFLYDGRPSTQVLAGCQRKETALPLDPARTKRTITWTDPQTGLEVRCEAIVYADFPTLEWTLYFRNTGKAETPILENIEALDIGWERTAEGEFLLHHAAGSQANRSDYAPRETVLAAGQSKHLGGAGGRPTNVDWSYFNLEWDDRGAIVAIGWPGQWAAQLQRDADRKLRLQAGQELVRTKLLPGEEIRSPLIVLQFWQGDYCRSQNAWRRWMMAHGMPKPAGKLPPPQFVASSSRAYEEMIGANEQNQIMHIDRYLEEGFHLDYWWMDAGWYIQQHGWPQVGTWEVDPKRFPNGFRPISDHAHSKGIKILVWFEPERVAPDTWLYDNHPEWLLSSGPSQAPLADLRSWSSSTLASSDPCVNYNPTSDVQQFANIRWEPGRLAFHPGPKGQYSVVRWTAPEAGSVGLDAAFLAIDAATTTSVHVLHNGKPLFQGAIRLDGAGPRALCRQNLDLKKGDTLDLVVGWGNGAHVCDSTGLEARLTGAGGKAWDAAKDYSPDKNPGGPWSYGYLEPGEAPDAAKFHPYDLNRRPTAKDARLLNLGDPAARTWLTEHIDRLLTREGIDLYRQDFNIDPLAFWRAADPPDRQGITENRYVSGFLAYWDELIRRHPSMLIDSCASGGRRNDLETMRRSVPLWRSDYAYEPIGHQCMTYGISLWLPYHGTGTVATSAATYYGGGLTNVEPYAFWSNAAPSLGSGVDFRVRQIDYEALRKLYRQWRELSKFYYDDFYPLTPYTQEANQWIAWQFHSPERGEGAVQAFRRGECPDEKRSLVLHDLDPEATYTIRVFGSDSTVKATGRTLMSEGLPVTLAEKPSAAVVHYHIP
ncbi:MAG: alpha-galactosidase [Thermoguttaceae bacterium]